MLDRVVNQKKLDKLIKIREIFRQVMPQYIFIFNDEKVSGKQFKLLKQKLAELDLGWNAVILKRSILQKYAISVSDESYVTELNRMNNNKTMILYSQSLSGIKTVFDTIDSVSELDFYHAQEIAKTDILINEGLTGLRPSVHSKELEKVGDLSIEKGIVKIRKPILLAKAGTKLNKTVEGILRYLEIPALEKKYDLKGLINAKGEVVCGESVLSLTKPEISLNQLFSLCYSLTKQTPLATEASVFSSYLTLIMLFQKINTNSSKHNYE